MLIRKLICFFFAHHFAASRNEATWSSERQGYVGPCSRCKVEIISFYLDDY